MRLSDEEARRVIKEWNEFANTRAWQYAVEEMEHALVAYAKKIGDPRLTERQIAINSGEVSAITRLLSLPETITNALGIELKLRESK